MRNGRHAVLLEPSRALCGTTPEQFADLLIRLVPLVDVARRERYERPVENAKRAEEQSPIRFNFDCLSH